MCIQRVSVSLLAVMMALSVRAAEPVEGGNMPKGTEAARWDSTHTSPTPKIVEWPIEKALNGAGRYGITFQYERGKSRYQIHAVEIVQDGKVLAADKHFGYTGASEQDNAYCVELPRVAAGPVILRATVSTDAGPESYGRILVWKAL